MKTINSPRLIIGKHSMSGFSGLSDGDLFGTINGTIYQLTSGQNGWFLRPLDSAGNVEWAKCHPNFQGVDYMTFIQTVNSLAA